MKAGDAVKIEDICDMILMDESYPIQEILKDKNSANESKEVLAKKILSYLNQGQWYVHFALTKHDLFRNVMPGNPFLITRFASELHSTLNSMQTIKDLYEKAKQLMILEDDGKSHFTNTKYKTEAITSSLWRST